MNKQNVSRVPDENEIEELLGMIQPIPSGDFHKKIEQTHGRLKRTQPGTTTNKPRLRFALAVIVFIVIITLAITPQGRAWAQEIVQFFRSVNSTTIVLSEEEKEAMTYTPEEYELPLVKVLTPALSQEQVNLPECQSANDARSYACQIAYAESELGFDLKELPTQPDGWEFESIYFDPNSKSAYIRYRIDIGYNNYSSITLTQGLGDNPTLSYYPLEAVPSDRIEVVKIGSYNGEYVKGWFEISNNDNELRWSDSSIQQRLGWTDGTRWFFINLFAYTTGAQSIERDQLIGLAESLVDKPNETARSLNPDFLYSVSDAEKLSGLDLKAPTLLPLGVDFSSAQYLSGSDKVLLNYGMNDELVIQEWMGKPTNFEHLSPTSDLNYEIVQVKGTNGFFALGDYGSSPYWFLWWSEGEMNYQIYYYQYWSGGGLLNKEKMIAIAESLSDINAVRSATVKPVEYVGIYEQALGFDIKEFPTMPAGWLFTSVSASVQPSCIVLSYTAKKDSGRLYIVQCASDMGKYFDFNDIPRNATESVKIGNSKGQYIIGNTELDNDGKMVWNPNLPFRTLRWQQDGLWMRIILSGDSISVYDKEDLIILAESLK